VVTLGELMMILELHRQGLIPTASAITPTLSPNTSGPRPSSNRRRSQARASADDRPKQEPPTRTTTDQQHSEPGNFKSPQVGRFRGPLTGQIVDASIIQAPRQRNTEEEKAALKEGRIPEDWAAKPAKLAQKDRDARWTLKRAKARKAGQDGTKAKIEIANPLFGHKNHIGIDAAHRLIRRFTVTSAAACDGVQLPAVLAKDTASGVWADTAYRSKANEKHLTERGLTSKIHLRRRPGQDLTPGHRKANWARSKVRSGIEGVFADQKCALGLVVRTIGLARATTKIALATLTYNFRRYLWLTEHPKTA